MNKLKGYIGCDPGAKGYYCLLAPGGIHTVTDFISLSEKPENLHLWLHRQMATFNVQVVMHEKVHAIQGTAAGSNFKFGWNAGGPMFLSQTMKCTVDLVTPRKWQQHIGVTKKGKAVKANVAEICERLYPAANIRGPRGGLIDGKSDALCIAHYASHIYR